MKKEKPEQCSGLFDGTGIFRLPASFFFDRRSTTRRSRSTAEIDVEQRHLVLVESRVMDAAGDLRLAFPREGQQCQNGCATAAAFTTFYNHLRWLDNSPGGVFIVLLL